MFRINVYDRVHRGRIKFIKRPLKLHQNTDNRQIASWLDKFVDLFYKHVTQAHYSCMLLERGHMLTTTLGRLTLQILMTFIF